MKKKLFISYSTENLNKVKLITKELKDHLIFEPLVVANKREPNKTLISKVTEGIEASYLVIPILTRGSIKTQWINQEIGYAIGKGKNVIPIVESRILSSLKGFIHKQNDIPYFYKTRTGISIRDENKSFMTCFRVLINDLDEAHRRKVGIRKLKSKSDLKKETPSTTLFLPLKKIIGTLAKTADDCPETGVWRSVTNPSKTIHISKGTAMPYFKSKEVSWRLIHY